MIVGVGACGKTSSEAPAAKNEQGSKKRQPRRATGPSASDCGVIHYDRSRDDAPCEPGHLRKIDCFIAAARECRPTQLVDESFFGVNGTARITFRVEPGCRVTWESDYTQFKPAERGRDRRIERHACENLHEYDYGPSPVCSHLRCWDDE